MKKKLYEKRIVISCGILLLVVIFTLIRMTLKDSYAYYGGSNELPIIEATIGKLKPTIKKVYIEAENKQYTNNTNPSVTITWSDDNITEYCVTLDSNCTEFKPIDSNIKSVTTQIQLSGEGNHTVNAYIKNKYGYTSAASSGSITLDTTAPTISELKTTEIKETSVIMSFKGNDTISGIKQYCYSTTNSNYTCNDMNREEIAFTISELESGKNYTVYVYLIDNAGNEGKSSPNTCTFTTISKSAKDVVVATSKSLESEADFNSRNAKIIGNIKDDLRRFVGSYTDVADNFICFGTSNQDTCKKDMDTYMYRIIGIDTSGRLKLIKATKINYNGTTTFQWHAAYYDNTKWSSSGLYNGLNNKYFMSNTKYNYMQQEQWTNLIDPTTYYIGDSKDKTNPNLFINERKSNFSSENISLMYLSDYLYANNGQANANNWLFIQNGLNRISDNGNTASNQKEESEWTMTRYGYGSDRYGAWFVDSGGAVYDYILSNSLAVRPVFYIYSSKIKLKGTGIITDPYYIINVN